MRKVDEGVKAVVSETIPTLKDPRIGFVTVTGVVTTSDLAQASVWLSVYGGEEARRPRSPRSRARPASCRRAIKRELHLRRTPQLTFEYDRASSTGSR